MNIYIVIAETIGTDGSLTTEVKPVATRKEAERTCWDMFQEIQEKMNVLTSIQTLQENRPISLTGDGWSFSVRWEKHELPSQDDIKFNLENLTNIYSQSEQISSKIEEQLISLLADYTEEKPLVLDMPIEPRDAVGLSSLHFPYLESVFVNDTMDDLVCNMEGSRKATFYEFDNYEKIQIINEIIREIF